MQVPGLRCISEGAPAMNVTSTFCLILSCVSLTATAYADLLVLKDGRQILGSVEGNARQISVKAGDAVQSFPIDQVQSIRFSPLDGDVLTTVAPPAPSFNAQYNQSAATAPSAALPVNLPAGMEIAVRTIDPIDSKKTNTTREYAASLADALVVDGVMIAPVGTNATLRVGDFKNAGLLKGNASLTLRLVALEISGRRINVETSDFVSNGAAKGARTGKGAGIGGLAGAGIGALGGGLAGAGIGAAAGSVVGGAVGAAICAIKDKNRAGKPAHLQTDAGGPGQLTEAQ